MLSDVLPVIEWQASQERILDETENDYGISLSRRLGALLAQLEPIEPGLAEQLFATLVEAETSTLRRVMLAPETSSRLLWSDMVGTSASETAVFLREALDVEFARLSGSLPKATAVNGRVWSALGDTCFDRDRGGWVDQPALGGLTIDAKSPAVGHFDGDLRVGAGLFTYADPAARDAALNKLRAAMDALDQVSSTLADYVRRFTLVANVVVDPQIERFSSGSMNQYIGRSIFWNAHLASIDVATVAEGLVHEAVHSLLFMKDAHSPWLPTKVDPKQRIISPWSGAKLPVEPFLQACFVWYALWHFWTLTGRSSVFTDERVEKGLLAARQGFLKGPLVERVSVEVSLEARTLINIMQAKVTRQESA